MPPPKRTFRMFVEEELGEFPHFVVGAVLEWLLIASLFIDGFLAYLSNKFATIFQLHPPCVLCTRIDKSMAGTNPSSYYNNSICELHKKDISSLAYCHVHRRLSDIRNMCEGCLLSFGTDKETDSDDIKKPVEQKDDDVSKDGDQKMTLKPVKTGKENNSNIRAFDMSKCSCCGEPYKTRTASKVFVRTPSTLRNSAFAPTLTPRVPLTPMGWRQDEARNADLPHIRYTELRFVSDNEPDMPEDNSGLNVESKIVKDDVKSTTAPLLPDDESSKTPSFVKGNKFFGTGPAEATNSPRFANKLPKKLPLENLDLVSDTSDDGPVEGDSILHHLKRQVRADRKMLAALYQELNEERSASAVAANNSMAMITRLQAEKASIEMEALQYQRMMEEQAEYDEEAIQILKDMLVQKEKDIKIMEAELELYKEKYGEIKKEDSDEFEGDADDHFQDMKSQSEYDTPREREDTRVAESVPSLDFETERSQVVGMLKNLEDLIHSSNERDHEDTDIEAEKKAIMEREVSLMKERLRTTEANNKYLKHTASTLRKGDERAELLTEIAQNLRRLRT